MLIELLYGLAFLTLVFVVHIFTNSFGNLLLNRLLGVMFLLRLNGIILFISFSNGFYTRFFYLASVIECLAFLNPVSVYLYFRAFLMDETRLKKTDAWHLTPFVLAVILYPIIVLNSPSLNSDPSVFGSKFNLVFLAIGSLHFLIYIYFCFRSLIRTLKNKEKKISRVSKNWLLVVLSLVALSHLLKFVLSIFMVVGIVEMNNYFNSIHLYVVAGVTNTIFILYILRNPHLLYGNLTPRHVVEPASSPIAIEEAKEDLPPMVFPSNELLDAVQMEAYLCMIQNHMKKDHPFLDPLYTLREMSEQLQIPLHHCSYVLNQGLKKNFREYINQYRIDYFIEQYPSRIAKETLESIACSSGFKSTSTFYTAFKKEKGSTPSEYFIKIGL